MLEGGVVEVHCFNQSEWLLYEIREAVHVDVVGVILQSAISYDGEETIRPPTEREGPVLPGQTSWWRERVELPVKVEDYHLIECS